jgi:hypothetical protein
MRRSDLLERLSVRGESHKGVMNEVTQPTVRWLCEWSRGGLCVWCFHSSDIILAGWGRTCPKIPSDFTTP